MFKSILALLFSTIVISQDYFLTVKEDFSDVSISKDVTLNPEEKAEFEDPLFFKVSLTC